MSAFTKSHLCCCHLYMVLETGFQNLSRLNCTLHEDLSDILVCSKNSTHAQKIKYFEHNLNSEDIPNVLKIKTEFDLSLQAITQKRSTL